MLNPAFWWLLRSLVGSRERVYIKVGEQYIVEPQPESCGDQSPSVPTVVAPMLHSKLWTELMSFRLPVNLITSFLEDRVFRLGVRDSYFMMSFCST